MKSQKSAEINKMQINDKKLVKMYGGYPKFKILKPTFKATYQKYEL
jgi:alcohol dehydrogenase YqhD (iron-dependent ADH family)